MACNACTDVGDLGVKICVSHEVSQNTVMSVSDDSQEPGKSWARMGRFRYPPHRSQICCPADLSHLRHPIAKFRKSVVCLCLRQERIHGAQK
jgi:hypothetical protein